MALISIVITGSVQFALEQSMLVLARLGQRQLQAHGNQLLFQTRYAFVFGIELLLQRLDDEFALHDAFDGGVIILMEVEFAIVHSFMDSRCVGRDVVIGGAAGAAVVAALAAALLAVAAGAAVAAEVGAYIAVKAGG